MDPFAPTSQSRCPHHPAGDRKRGGWKKNWQMRASKALRNGMFSFLSNFNLSLTSLRSFPAGLAPLRARPAATPRRRPMFMVVLAPQKRHFHPQLLRQHVALEIPRWPFRQCQSKRTNPRWWGYRRALRPSQPGVHTPWGSSALAMGYRDPQGLFFLGGGGGAVTPFF